MLSRHLRIDGSGRHSLKPSVLGDRNTVKVQATIGNLCDVTPRSVGRAGDRGVSPTERPGATPCLRGATPLVLCFLAVALSSGCGNDSLTEPAGLEPTVCTETFEPKQFDHEVIGFYPSWKHGVLPVSRIRWDAFTRVIYAFGLPTPGGQLRISDLTQVETLVREAHAHGVEVYFSVGGGAGSDAFPIMAADPSSRRQFVFEVVDYLGTHCLDGVDIDWESWTKDGDGNPDLAEMQNLVSLLTEMREALNEGGLQLSLDVFASDWFGRHYSDALVPLVDQIHVMGYDFSGPWSSPGPHSSYEQAIGAGADRSATGLAYWRAYRGWPIEKTYLGVPFYGRDFDVGGGAGIAYRDIVAAHPDAPDSDRVANIYYNGVATIEAKTHYVVNNSYPGVMIWEIAHDSEDENISLLSAIDRVVRPAVASRYRTDGASRISDW